MSRLRFVDETGSTNADLLEDLDAVEGDWLIATRQHTGRGRQGRAWLSPDGNFYGSTMAQVRAGDAAPPTLSLVAGLALIEALETAAPAIPLNLKWPNDLLRGKGKLAGILLERAGDRIVAGFGVNLAVAPPIEGRETASLSDVSNLTPRRLLHSSRAVLLACSVHGALVWLARLPPPGKRVPMRADHALRCIMARTTR